MVLVVTEPTLAGLHDFRRVAELCRQFNVETGVCINKADLNPELCTHIETAALTRGISVLGRIRYDRSVTAAQMKRMAVVETGDGPAATDIRALWARVKEELDRVTVQPGRGVGTNRDVRLRHPISEVRT